MRTANHDRLWITLTRVVLSWATLTAAGDRPDILQVVQMGTGGGGR
ncbi:MAG TPA: hypothetical protein VKV73_05900 [Chloroflexota bacterium]|nr:hypothetical protein [Chloroflexota bacterium]